MKKEGYIKFECNWKITPPFSFSEYPKMNRWRNKFYRLGLIGTYKDGVGFGNISVRTKRNGKFIITGSQTGGFKKLLKSHYTRVISYDIAKNSVTCKGPIKASSESMTHAAVYKIAKNANAVIHVHSLKLWRKLLNRVPTSNKQAAYGTPEMAKEIFRLYKETDLRNQKMMVMGGHQEGILTFGENLDEAGRKLLAALKNFSGK